jgi:hypothetical protein
VVSQLLTALLLSDRLKDPCPGWTHPDGARGLSSPDCKNKVSGADAKVKNAAVCVLQPRVWTASRVLSSWLDVGSDADEFLFTDANPHRDADEFSFTDANPYPDADTLANAVAVTLGVEYAQPFPNAFFDGLSS